MKPIVRFLMLAAAAVLMASCLVYRSVPTTSRVYSTGYRYIDNPIEQRAILRANYPQLYNYYEEGLLEIVSMRERLYSNGHREWDIRRRYVKRYITDGREQMRVLQFHYPDVYSMVRRGDARVTQMYGYVDNSGRIRYKVNYSRTPAPRPNMRPEPGRRGEPRPGEVRPGEPRPGQGRPGNSRSGGRPSTSSRAPGR